MESLLKFLIEFIPSGIEPHIFAVQFAFACIGAMLILLNDLKKRDKGSKRTPERFNLRFFLYDNLLRVGFGALVMWALLYFSALVIPEDSSNQMRYLIAAVIGAFSDFIFSRLIKATKTAVLVQIEKIFPKSKKTNE